MKEIERIVREELGKVAKVDTMALSDDANIPEIADLDSLSILDLFELMEERFGIVISPEKVIEMTTIKNIVRVVEEFKQNK